MVNYVCERCGKCFNKRSNYITHKNRKFICQNVLETNNNISTYKNLSQFITEFSELKKLLQNNLGIKNTNSNEGSNYGIDEGTNGKYGSDDGKLNDKMYNISTNNIVDNNLLNNETDIATENKLLDCKNYGNLTCPKCNAIFSNKGNRDRHINKYCKKRDKVEENNKKMEKQIEELKIQNKKLNTKLDELENIVKLKNNDDKNVNVTNITQNNNINNINSNVTNIVMVDFSSDKNMPDLTSKEKIRALSKGFLSTKELAKIVHFNPKYPEYHNVYIPCIKDKYGLICNGKNWNWIDRDELIDIIYDRYKDYIEVIPEDDTETYNKLPAPKKKSLKRWLKTEDNSDAIKDVKKEIMMLLVNEKHIPIETKKLVKKNGRKLLPYPANNCKSSKIS